MASQVQDWNREEVAFCLQTARKKKVVPVESYTRAGGGASIKERGSNKLGDKGSTVEWGCKAMDPVLIERGGTGKKFAWVIRIKKSKKESIKSLMRNRTK